MLNDGHDWLGFIFGISFVGCRVKYASDSSVTNKLPAQDEGKSDGLLHHFDINIH